MEASEVAQLSFEHRFDSVTFRQKPDTNAAWNYRLLLLVLALHIWLGWTLFSFHPKIKLRTMSLRPTSAENIVVVLDFRENVPRPTASLQPSTSSLAAHPPNRARVSAIVKPAPTGGEIGPIALPALNLTFGTDQPTFVVQRSPFDRNVVLGYQETRFQDAWVSNGTLTDVLASKSRLASFLLGGTGALRKPCTEAQRSRYDVICVPDQYQHPDPVQGKQGGELP